MHQMALKAVLSKVPEVYNPLRKRTQPWVSLAQLHRSYASQGGGCACM